MKTRKIVLDGDRSREADMPLFSFHADGNRIIIKPSRKLAQRRTTYSVKQPSIRVLSA